MGMIERKKSILLNEPHLATASGSIATFDTDMRSKLKECKINFLPVQSGSGSPSPTNIRPITGLTGLTGFVTRKNLLNPNSTNCVRGRTILSNGTLTTAASISVSDYIKVGEGIQLTYKSASVNTPGAAYNRRIVCFDKDKNYISSIAETTGNPQTDIVTNGITPTGTAYVRVPFYTNYSITSGHQLEIGSSATAYEPYTETAIPISWQSEAGTLYGGYVDLVSGELVVDTALITFDGSSDEQWNVENLSSGKSFYMWKTNINPTPSPTSQYSADSARYPSKAKCNQARIQNYGELYSSGLFFFSERALNMHLGTILGISTVADFKAYLSSHNLQVVYELATKTTYQLSLQQIKTFIGRNNIWSDAGDVEVQYWKH